MAFLNCYDDHHTVTLGGTDNDAPNHIAFLIPTLDAVMRGGGRMKDAGHAIECGPGRNSSSKSGSTSRGPFHRAVHAVGILRSGWPADPSHDDGRTAQAAGLHAVAGVHTAAVERTLRERVGPAWVGRIHRNTHVAAPRTGLNCEAVHASEIGERLIGRHCSHSTEYAEQLAEWVQNSLLQDIPHRRCLQ